MIRSARTRDGGIARRVERLHGILAAVDARFMQQVEQHRFQRLVLLPVEKPVFPDDIRKIRRLDLIAAAVILASAIITPLSAVR